MAFENEISPALEITGVCKTYRSHGKTLQALKNVSFEVAQGEFFGLLGQNGAGKSTLISALAGLVRPDAGTIRILGADAARDQRFCKMAIGIVPQEISFDPFFTVWETLKLQSGFYGLRKNDAWLEELLERMELSGKKNESVARLSGGMKRRVLIAQALVHKPPAIVLDEPTAGVDVELRRRLWDFMRELNSNGHTVILTTHYLEEAQQLCKRIALLGHGEVLALDETDRLLHRFSDERIMFRHAGGELPESILGRTVEKTADGMVCVSYASPDELRMILNCLHECGCTMEQMQMGPANLEEVFIRITNEKPRSA